MKYVLAFALGLIVGHKLTIDSYRSAVFDARYRAGVL